MDDGINILGFILLDSIFLFGLNNFPLCLSTIIINL